MVDALRVGIIGANASGGWAGDAHVPAVAALPGLTLEAIATNSQDTADAAARVFGVTKAYASGIALIADPAIDVVTVATRVPDHRPLLLAAAAAGKHVYSEWPLGRGTAEAGEIAAAVASAGVGQAIGLQLRGSPAVMQVRTLLAAGAIGRILSMSAYSTTAGFGPEVAPQFAYLEDPAAFANLVTIQGAHTLDLMLALGGGLESIAAQGDRQFPEVLVGPQRERRRRDIFDHLLVQGRFRTGVPFGLEVAGGRKGETPFRLDIVGERGVLQLVGGAPRGVQSSRLAVLHDGRALTAEDDALPALPDPALNVAGLYRALRDDIRHGTHNVVGFAHAEALTRLIEDVLQSARDGRRLQDDGAWPQG